jgi:hypothetical protein
MSLHSHHHHHHHPVAAPPGISLLRFSAGHRLLIAAGLSALVWIAVLWAMEVLP